MRFSRKIDILSFKMTKLHVWKSPTKILLEKCIFSTKKSFKSNKVKMDWNFDIDTRIYAISFWYFTKRPENLFWHFINDSGHFRPITVTFHLTKIMKIKKNIDFSKFNKSAGTMFFVQECILWAQDIFAQILVSISVRDIPQILLLLGIFMCKNYW